LSLATVPLLEDLTALSQAWKVNDMLVFVGAAAMMLR
jgi:hypothetical protein